MVSPIRWIRWSEGHSRILLIALFASLLLSTAYSAAPFSAAAQEARSAEGGGEETPASEEVPQVALAQFTSGIENREPIDQISFVANDVSKVFFFSDLRGLTGKTVIHRWTFQGQIVAEVAFDVRGPRWRVWSSKELKPDMTGDWTVEIVLPGDEVLAAETFTLSPVQR